MKIRIHILIQLSCLAICTYIVNTIVLNEDFLYKIYEDTLDKSRIKEMINDLKDYAWVSYVYIFLSPLKCCVIGALLYIAFFFSETKLTYSKAFQIAVWGEYVFILSQIIVTIIIVNKQDIQSLADIQAIYPLSLMELFKASEIPKWAIYPLKTMNAFEVIYVFVLAALSAKSLGIKWIKATESVAVAYVLGLSSWVIFIVFMVFNY